MPYLGLWAFMSKTDTLEFVSLPKLAGITYNVNRNSKTGTNVIKRCTTILGSEVKHAVIVRFRVEFVHLG